MGIKKEWGSNNTSLITGEYLDRDLVEIVPTCKYLDREEEDPEELTEEEDLVEEVTDNQWTDRQYAEPVNRLLALVDLQ